MTKPDNIESTERRIGEYRIVRTNEDSDTGYTHEFVMFDSDWNKITTATRVESLLNIGFEDIDSWTNVLEVFANEYAENGTVNAGLDAVAEEYNLN